MIYLTADTHFGHKNIIKYCRRPFDSVEQMNEILIKNWNLFIDKDDEVYVLGDFIWKPSLVDEIVSQLNGKILLVPGNHDERILKKLKAYEGKVEILPPLVNIDSPDYGQLVLCHYPLASWWGKEQGSYHFHGHTHYKDNVYWRLLDVGVDAQNFFPLSLVEAMMKANDLLYMY